MNRTCLGCLHPIDDECVYLRTNTVPLQEWFFHVSCAKVVARMLMTQAKGIEARQARQQWGMNAIIVGGDGELLP